MHRTTLPRLLACVFLILSMPAFAQQGAPASSSTARTLPTWEQLTPAEREALVAPLRERWNNADPAHRQRMLDHARRWEELTPEQRRTARKGQHRWEHLTPDQREQARALYQRMRHMDQDERVALRKQWHAMTPEQRKAWLDANPPVERRPKR